MPHIQVVIPVLNEEAIVPTLTRSVAESVGKITDDYGIIVVDDGSTDGTWAEIRRAAEQDARVDGLKLTRNFGQHSAITAGLAAANADWVVVMDGDMQDRPEVIPELYAKAREGFDVVFVARQERPVGLAYKAAQWLFYRTLRFLAQTDYDPAHGNFSIISRKVLECYQHLPEGNRFYGGLLNWLGFRTTTISAMHGQRLSGRPSYDFRKRFRLATDIIVSFSVRPLHAAIGIGLVCSTFSFVYGLIIIIRAFANDVSVEGWASLIVSIYFVGGIIMILLGMNSLYLGKVYSEVKRRPVYVVAETAKDPVPAPGNR